MQKTDTKKTHTEKNTNTPKEKLILDLVATESRFTKLNQAIKLAGLTERFQSPNNITFFAPTNDAFSKLGDKAMNLLSPENSAELKKILLMHVVPGALGTEDLKKANMLKTEGGQQVPVSVSADKKEIKLSDAKVVLPQEEAKNGYLYPLDAVIQPKAAAAIT